MMAEDVKPTRLEAAKSAARDFIRAMPTSARIGLVAFSDYGTVLVPPSTDRPALEEALGRLQPQQATAVGSAILEALRVLPGRAEFLGDRLTQLRGPVPQAPPTPAPAPGPQTPPAADALPPAAILILSDGVSNLGADPRAAAALAAEAKVKIYAVGVGQQGGSVMQLNNQLVLVPFDPTALQEVARQTGGEYFPSNSLPELRRIYRQMGRSIGWERRRTEITSVVAGAATIRMLTGGMLSMIWFRRVP
jgi:Ca-activated chloride channel family protein